MPSEKVRKLSGISGDSGKRYLVVSLWVFFGHD